MKMLQNENRVVNEVQIPPAGYAKDDSKWWAVVASSKLPNEAVVGGRVRVSVDIQMDNANSQGLDQLQSMGLYSCSKFTTGHVYKDKKGFDKILDSTGSNVPAEKNVPKKQHHDPRNRSWVLDVTDTDILVVVIVGGNVRGRPWFGHWSFFGLWPIRKSVITIKQVALRIDVI